MAADLDGPGPAPSTVLPKVCDNKTFKLTFKEGPFQAMFRTLCKEHEHLLSNPNLQLKQEDIEELCEVLMLSFFCATLTKEEIDSGRTKYHVLIRKIGTENFVLPKTKTLLISHVKLFYIPIISMKILADVYQYEEVSLIGLRENALDLQALFGVNAPHLRTYKIENCNCEKFWLPGKGNFSKLEKVEFIGCTLPLLNESQTKAVLDQEFPAQLKIHFADVEMSSQCVNLLKQKFDKNVNLTSIKEVEKPG